MRNVPASRFLPLTLFFSAIAVVYAPGLLPTAQLSASEIQIGFLSTASDTGQLGTHDRAAMELARQLQPGMETVLIDADHPLTAEQLARFDVLWYHQGDSPELAGPIVGAKTLKLLSEYVKQGGGLYVSGAALAMVHRMGIEPVEPRVGASGNDKNPATVTPLIAKHPIFKGISAGGRPVQLSSVGHPAFADFHARGGPSTGMLLARTGSTENPIVEYELGKGRVIAVGWRASDYGNMSRSTCSENLQRLTANIFDYLADDAKWEKVVISPVQGKPQPKTPPKPTAEQLLVSDEEITALERAINDLHETFGEKYPDAERFLEQLKQFKLDIMSTRLEAKHFPTGLAAFMKARTDRHRFEKLKAEALLANPLIDFDQLMYIRRSTNRLGMPANWESNSSLPKTGYDNELRVISPFAPDAESTVLYRPDGGRFIGDVDLEFDGNKMLFSMPGENGRWQVHEMNADASDLHELPLITEPDVDNYDACYLPDGRVIFSSTAPMVGVPCVRGNSHVTNLYVYDPENNDSPSGGIRQLTVDQEHNWCPTVLNNGRVLYQRWEYTDTPHAFYRLLFQMNPDGTQQMEYYGSNSYWPNSMFYARPILGHPTKVVTIVTGHHDNKRMGELIILDPMKGRFEADGVVQRIPGYGEKVEPILLDGLTKGKWPMFLHPYPLSEKHFIVSCQPGPSEPMGIYLVDIFDNMLKIADEPGYALLEPVPMRASERPPVVPDAMFDSDQKEATIMMSDVYMGGGLKGVKPGTIKQLRLITYNFSYQGMGGQVDRVGMDGPWDIKAVLGTVPVEEDGSANFTVPAYTPVAVQPLDQDGKAVALMRSWFTAMPGEVLTCVGCHESQNTTFPSKRQMAVMRPPSKIEPWYGPARGFSFRREVQPVLDKYCVSCHDGRTIDGPDGEKAVVFDLRNTEDRHPQALSKNYNDNAHFSQSYMNLKQFVRGPTIESDAHMLPPREFHVDSTRLGQVLLQGHYDVELDKEAKDRLYAWIDLNTPFHGTWVELAGADRTLNQAERRRELRLKYTGVDSYPEEIVNPYQGDIEPVLSAEEAEKRMDMPRQLEAAIAWMESKLKSSSQTPLVSKAATELRSIKVNDSLTLKMARVPAGENEFGMGSEVANPFLIGQYEITNAQYAQFDPSHDSRLEHGDFLQFSHAERGWPLNGPDQPVVRVSRDEAQRFCQWLSEKTGRKFRLPTDWEWRRACGSHYAQANMNGKANLSDQSARAVETLAPWSLPSGAIPEWRLADTSYDDGYRVSAPVGSFEPNDYGVYDMIGNAAEWVTNANLNPSGEALACGGSWYDRANGYTRRFGSDYVVFDVGFRVVCEEE